MHSTSMGLYFVATRMRKKSKSQAREKCRPPQGFHEIISHFYTKLRVFTLAFFAFQMQWLCATQHAMASF
jgi:hypothetical protein